MAKLCLAILFVFFLVPLAHADGTDTFVLSDGPANSISFVLPSTLTPMNTGDGTYFIAANNVTTALGTTPPFPGDTQVLIDTMMFGASGTNSIGGRTLEAFCTNFTVSPVSWPFFNCDNMYGSDLNASVYTNNSNGTVTFIPGTYSDPGFPDAGVLTITPNPAATPEPSSLLLLVFGLAALLALKAVK